MKCCPKCNGRGTVGYFHIDHFADIECDRCNGSGEVSEVPMTNEEYLKSCNTEQLAEFFIKAMLFYDNAGITLLEAIKNAVEDKEKLGSYFMESVLEWLKQPHHSKE